jgi:hypothetical protein
MSHKPLSPRLCSYTEYTLLQLVAAGYTLSNTRLLDLTSYHSERGDTKSYNLEESIQSARLCKNAAKRMAHAPATHPGTLKAAAHAT